MIGKTISHYKILEKLGGGGMGVVYKAKDTNLDRTVALKFLPPNLLADKEAEQRFIHEAKAASALEHANICNIHEIDETDDGQIFIVLSCYEGETLKKKIERGPLKIEETIDVAIQIAEGLCKAHEKEIIHRDIKPANIFITNDGVVKILDFGLAKVSSQTQLTQMGGTVGTVAYMSPEQTRGEKVDQRTDIWALGIVLYEMITGQTPFKGDYEQAVIFSILNDELDLSVLTERNVPALFIDVLKNTLEKNTDNRFQSIDDVISILKNTKQEQVKTQSKTQYIIYGVLSILIIVLLIWNQFGTVQEPLKRPETKFTKLTFDPGLEDEPTWSPDGKFLAYTTDDRGNFDIIVKPLDGGKSIRIVDHKADDAQASWSPDGNTIAFVSSRDHATHLSYVLGQEPLTQYIYAKNGDIFVIPALGGQQIKVVENGYYPQWSPDSKMLIYQSNTNGYWDIWVTSIKGGEPVQLTNDEDFDYHPTWSQDGKWILYASRIYPNLIFSIKAVPADGGDPITLMKMEDWILNPRLSDDNNYLIFSSTRSGTFNITKVPIDMEDFNIQKNYQSITLSESEDVNLSIGSLGPRIAYASITNNSDIYELDLGNGKITAITTDNAINDKAHLSPDGSNLLYDSDREGIRSAWITNLTSNEIYSIGTRGVYGVHRWTPDGSSFIYQNEKGLVLKKLGDANERILISQEANLERLSGFPMLSWNNKYVAYGDSGIIVFNFENNTSVKLTHHALDNHPTWSPDNKYIVFHRGQGTGRELYYIDLEGNEKQLTSGNSEDSHPYWSPVNPDEILFLRDHKNLFLLSVSTGEVKQITEYKKANISLDYPSFSSDGKKVYYSLLSKIGDIFILENF